MGIINYSLIKRLTFILGNLLINWVGITLINFWPFHQSLISIIDGVAKRVNFPSANIEWLILFIVTIVDDGTLIIYNSHILFNHKFAIVDIWTVLNLHRVIYIIFAQYPLHNFLFRLIGSFVALCRFKGLLNRCCHIFKVPFGVTRILKELLNLWWAIASVKVFLDFLFLRRNQNMIIFALQMLRLHRLILALPVSQSNLNTFFLIPYNYRILLFDRLL